MSLSAAAPAARVTAAALAATTDRFAVLGVATHLLAIPTDEVREMFVLPETRRPPGAPPQQRGVVSLRGRVLPALDVRVCLGLTSARAEMEEFVALLAAREQDHKSWLAALEESVRAHEPFKLAVDPRKCKFGQWFYGFKSDNVVIANELARFEEPHAQIHQLAIGIEGLKAAGGDAEALRRIEAAKGGLLSELVALFERLQAVVREQHKEIGVVVRSGRREAVLIVDRAEAVAPLEPFEGDDDPIASGTLPVELVSAVARWKESTRPVLRIDLERLMDLAG